jgi:Tol biopolymer transport system component
MALANGSCVGPYEVTGWLGAGGMGEVYRAVDTRLGREVAIKIIHEALASDHSRVLRFEREARAAGQLNHPNILAVHDAGTCDRTPYIVSELLEGETLSGHVPDTALPPRRAIECARQIADGLAAAHARGIVHRDLKPDNLFVTTDGRVKILDFGIAKLIEGDDEPDRAGVTQTGSIVGTAAYMSPEQVRGEAVDERSDIFSLGVILHEMLAGAAAFARETTAETMAAVLREAPHGELPHTLPPGLERIVARCLEKTRDARFQSARDLAFALEGLTSASASGIPRVRAGSTWPARIGLVAALAALVTAALWIMRDSSAAQDNPLAGARFSRLTDSEGTEASADISADGRFVAFLTDANDRDGDFEIRWGQLGTNSYTRLMPVTPPSIILRHFGFSGDGSEVWFGMSADARAAKQLMPLTGGAARPFLAESNATPAWSPDGSRVAFMQISEDGDALAVADGTGSEAREIVALQPGVHNHNPAWSPDAQWIYFVRGVNPTSGTDPMNVWRVSAGGGVAEQLTQQEAAINFLAPLDEHTLLYVARDADGSGPWLWALDIERKVARRATVGLERYTSVAASRDGRRVVATVATPTASLWRVPLLPNGVAEEQDATPYPVSAVRALAPRVSGSSVFFLSNSGSADGLWRFLDGQAVPLRRAGDGALFDPPAVLADGTRVALVVRRGGKRHVVLMQADGTDSQTLSTALEIESPADWSPQGDAIVVSASDADGSGLFSIPIDGGAPRRITRRPAFSPAWSPDGRLIVYTPRAGGAAPVLGVRPDGTAVPLPAITAHPGAYRFLPDGSGLVYLPHTQSPDFWLLDFAAQTTRPITRLSRRGALRTFDITRDGREIVFDRSRDNSDIVLIELPPK